MFKIGEFSKLTQVTIRMLRYYDEKGLLKPSRVDPQSGYRMYAADQILTLNRIIYLRDSGFNVSEIKPLIKSLTNATLVDQLDKKQEEIKDTIRIERDKLEKIERAKRAFLCGKDDLTYNFNIKALHSQQVLSVRRVLPDYYAEDDLIEELYQYTIRHLIKTLDDIFVIYHDTYCKERDVDIEVCVPVKKALDNDGDFKYRKTSAVPIVAGTFVYGNIEKIDAAHYAFAQWLLKNDQYKMCGKCRQNIVRGPHNESNADQYLTEILIPLKKSNKKSS